MSVINWKRKRTNIIRPSLVYCLHHSQPTLSVLLLTLPISLLPHPHHSCNLLAEANQCGFSGFLVLIPMMVVSKIQAINGAEIEEGFKMTGICSTNSWRGVEIKEDDDMLRTVECLRGRLLAERVASRAAKEESDLMFKRLTELERLLTVEIKARNRAEKRLRCVLKKLQSLKIVPGISDDSGPTPTDASLAFSSSSSSSSSPGIQFPRTTKSSLKTGDSGDSTGSEGGEGSAYFSANSANHSVNQEVSWSSAESSSSVGNDNLLCQDEATESKQTLLEDELIKDDNTSLTVTEEDDLPTLQKSKEKTCQPYGKKSSCFVDTHFEGVLSALRT